MGGYAFLLLHGGGGGDGVCVGGGRGGGGRESLGVGVVVEGRGCTIWGWAVILSPSKKICNIS